MESFFEAKVSYFDDGDQKKVTRNYLVDAITFTDAEANATKYLTEWLDLQVFDIKSLKKVQFEELVYKAEDEGASWYEASVKMEFDGKEAIYKYLVADHSVKDATRQLLKHFEDSENPPVIKGIVERGIADIVMRKECCKECNVCDSTYRIISFEEQKGIEMSFEELDKINAELIIELGATAIRNKRFVIDATRENLNRHKGKRLGRRVVKNWKEEFVDEDNGEVVSIDRSEVLVSRGVEINDDIIDVIVSGKVEEVEIYL